MTRPNWLSERPVYEVHEDQIAEHGGAPGIRDPGLADIALARPLNAFAYGVEDIFDLAALYAAGIVKPPLHRWQQSEGLYPLGTFPQRKWLVARSRG
jgi:hypothetical protein